MGCIYSGSAQSVWRGLAQSQPFGPRAKQRIQSPPSPTRLYRPIPAGQRRRTREGGAGEEAWTKGNPWVAIGWKEAHHSGVSTVVVLGRRGNDDAGPVVGSKCSGNWSTSSGCSGEAVARVGGAGGRSVRAIDGRCSVARE
jgi:hypothetical protein